MISSKYLELRKRASVVPDKGDYSIQQAEMNPEIVSMAIRKIAEDGLPKKIWEPFASPRSKYGISGDFECVSYGVKGGCDVIADSTKNSPSDEFGCVIFHPPYFSSAPQSDCEGELSLIEAWDDYCEAIKMAMRNATTVLVDRGFIVAVGRDYRAASMRVRLDELYIEAMDGLLEIEEVWKSEPDVVLIARKMI